MQSDNQNLDPQVVNLAQAIRHVESNGDYEAKGASGEYGAYQFEPDTWNALAPHFGVNVPLNQATPEEQNEVAYKQLALWKQSNPTWNVGNFASAWNAGVGNPNAYQENHVGVNSQGVSYDTPAYAAKIAQTYQQIKAGSFNPTVESANPEPSLPSAAQTTQTDPNATSGMPAWEKLLLGGAAVAGGVGLTALSGGLDLFGLGAAGAAEGAADIGGVAAAAETATEAAEGGSGISDALSAAKPYVNTANTIKNVVTGGSSSPVQQPTPITPQTNSIPQNNSTAPQSSVNNQQPVQQPQSSISSAFQPSANATNTIYNAQNQALQQTPTGRVIAQTGDAQNAMRSNAMYGLNPEINQETGAMDSSGAIKKSKGIVDELDDQTSKILDAEGTKVNLDEAVAAAKQNMRQYNPSHEWDEADRHIDEQAATYKKNFADKEGNISLGNLHRIKKEQGKAGGKWDIMASSAKKGAHRAFSSGARDTVTRHTQNKELYDLTMKEEKHLIAGQKILKRLDGKRPPKLNSLKKDIFTHFADYAAIAIGDKIGGPLGAILGSVVGAHIHRAADKKFGKSLMENPAIQKALNLVGNKRPEVAALLRKEIAKYGTIVKDVKENKPLPKKAPDIQMDMGTYKLGKNRETGRIIPTGQYRKPGVNFYPSKPKKK